MGAHASSKRLQTISSADAVSSNPSRSLAALLLESRAAAAFSPSGLIRHISAGPSTFGESGVARTLVPSMAEEVSQELDTEELQKMIADLESERDAKDAAIAEKDRLIESMKSEATMPPDSTGPPGIDVPASIADNKIFVDVESKLADASFKIPPDQLILLAKRFLVSAGGFGADGKLLSDDFKFVAPVVGPLSKDAFLGAIGSVDIQGAFPDFNGEFYGFHVDPFEGNRVWYTARGRGTNSGPLPPFAPTPTGKTVINPPQACSLTFNEQGLVTKYTIGYVMDREVGNTGGLGGLYGVLYAIGRPLPFPEAQPWQISPQYALFQQFGNLASKLFGN